MTKKESEVAAVIAIDGPSGSGKSSTSRGVARKLGFAYLDTGAMYRAVAWATLCRGIEPQDAANVGALVGGLDIRAGTDPEMPGICVDGVDVSGPIRSHEVTAAVSHVASVPRVREVLVALQRAIIAASPGGIVVEGRDIGTTVAPGARLKIYLVADPAARAARRAAEVEGDLAATQQSLLHRDRIDSSRATSPLAQAADAIVVDGTHLTLPEVIDSICRLVPEAL